MEISNELDAKLNSEMRAALEDADRMAYRMENPTRWDKIRAGVGRVVRLIALFGAVGLVYFAILFGCSYAYGDEIRAMVTDTATGQHVAIVSERFGVNGHFSLQCDIATPQGEQLQDAYMTQFSALTNSPGVVREMFFTGANIMRDALGFPRCTVRYLKNQPARRE